MINWGEIILLVLKAVAGVTDLLSRKQLLDAGAAEAISKGLAQTIDNVQKAKNVDKEINNNPDGEYAAKLRDKYTRD